MQPVLSPLKMERSAKVSFMMAMTVGFSASNRVVAAARSADAPRVVS